MVLLQDPPGGRDPLLKEQQEWMAASLSPPSCALHSTQRATHVYNFSSAMGLKQLLTSKVAVLPDFLPSLLLLGLVVSAGRKVARLGGGEDFLQNSQSCTFLFPTEIAEEGGGCGECGQQARSCWLAITRCPCARGLPLPRLRCNTFYIRFISSNYVARKPSDL